MYYSYVNLTESGEHWSLSDYSVIGEGVVMIIQKMVLGCHIWSGALTVKLGDQTQPEGESMGMVVISDLWFHGWKKYICQ